METPTEREGIERIDRRRKHSARFDMEGGNPHEPISMSPSKVLRRRKLTLEEQRFMAWVGRVMSTDLKKCSIVDCFALVPEGISFCRKHEKEAVIRRMLGARYYYSRYRPQEESMHIRCSRCKHFDNLETEFTCARLKVNILAVSCDEFEKEEPAAPEYPPCVYGYHTDDGYSCSNKTKPDKPDVAFCLACDCRTDTEEHVEK